MNAELLKYTNVRDDVSGMKRLAFISDFIDANFEKAKVLDVGCGTGSITIPLGLRHDVTGIDVDEKSIELAKLRNKFDNVKFFSEDIGSVKDLFDVVLCIQVLEHLENPEKMMKEISRVAKKYVIVTVPNGYGPSEVAGRIISKIRGKTRLKNITKTNEGMFTANYENPHIQKFTVKKMKIIADEAGFTIKNIKHHNFLLGTFPFNQLFFHTPMKRVLEKIDEKAADILPHFMVSGWYFVMEKK